MEMIKYIWDKAKESWVWFEDWVMFHPRAAAVIMVVEAAFIVLYRVQ